MPGSPQIPETKKDELNEFLENVVTANSFRKGGWLFFGMVFLISKLFSVYPISWFVVLILFAMFFLTVLYDFLVQKSGVSRNIQQAGLYYLIFQLSEFMLVLAILHISGVASFLGAFVLADYLFTAYFVYTKKTVYWGVLIFCIIGYIALITLEYSGILPVGDALGLGVPTTGNREVFVLGLIPNTTLLVFLFAIISVFSGKMREIILNLKEKEGELQDAKGVLEIKVKARTKELEDERISLEKKVEDRTRELREKINEMEKFQKMAVGRELKMIELKKELKELKKEV